MTQSKSGTEAGEEADRHDTQDIEEEHDEDRVDESQVKERLPEYANGERRHHHVCSKPLRGNQRKKVSKESSFETSGLETHHATNVRI